MIDTQQLTAAQMGELRKRHPYSPPLAWVGRLAKKRGWQEANVTYLETERGRSAAAMRGLMSELGVSRPASVAEALDLLDLAFEVFAPEDGFSGKIERLPDGQTLRVTMDDCPIYRALEEAEWHTVTACPSWHRRKGWFDALGVQATDAVLHEKKWGDPACVTEIQVQRVL